MRPWLILRDGRHSASKTRVNALIGGLLRMRSYVVGRVTKGKFTSPSPFAGMTRIRFKGFFSAFSGTPRNDS
jgi:hypothetical protein